MVWSRTNLYVRCADTVQLCAVPKSWRIVKIYQYIRKGESPAMKWDVHETSEICFIPRKRKDKFDSTWIILDLEEQMWH